jgi:hypothetical protein
VLNKLIFDGSEQSFYSFKIEISCPSCGKEIIFLADDMFPMKEMNLKSFPKDFVKQLNLRRRANGKIFKNSHGLEAYAIECQCWDCEARFIVVAGIGEIQPSRFNVFLEGVVK